jgi:small subunit ribosomal protein S20
MATSQAERTNELLWTGVVDKSILFYVYSRHENVETVGKDTALPNHKSNVKRMKTSAKERERNRAYRSQLRAAIKEVRGVENKDDAVTKLNAAFKLIDHAAAKKLIHRSTASRNKSRLALHVKKLG